MIILFPKNDFIEANWAGELKLLLLELRCFRRSHVSYDGKSYPLQIMRSTDQMPVETISPYIVPTSFLADLRPTLKL